MGFQSMHYLLYLGYPIYKGRSTRRLFVHVISKMRTKLEGWKGKFQSSGAKLTLIKSVLMSLPVYYFLLLEPPEVTIKEMHVLIFLE